MMVVGRQITVPKTLWGWPCLPTLGRCLVDFYDKCRWLEDDGDSSCQHHDIFVAIIV